MFAFDTPAGADRVALKDNIHPSVPLSIDKGPLEYSTRISSMRLVLKPSARQAAELELFLEQQRDPSSPDYRHWLTPEEFADRFSVNQNDLGKLTSWLQAEGFTVEQVARARNWIAFSGTAAQVSTTFRSELRRYSLNHVDHFANATAPSVPAALADVVESVRGLNDFRPDPPRLKRFSPDYTNSSGAHYLAPDDLAAIYDIAPLYKAGYDGTGQKLAIVGQTDISLSDIRAFRSKFGLPARDPQLVLYGSDPGVSTGDQMEADLDLEWSGAVARNATIVYVYSKNVFDSLEYAIDQNLAPVISMSYGGCESGNPSSFRLVAQQANAQGITWMNSSGDSGAAGCDPQGAASAKKGPWATFPADIPEVTGVGGTEFAETAASVWGTNGSTLASALSYIPEKVWNDSSLGQGIAAGGGGASQVFAKPWWQSGPGVPADSERDVPDVSLAASGAHDGYLMIASNSLYSVGGTSASSPSFAGIVTLLNQYLLAKGVLTKAGLGNINPGLYSLAQSAPAAFHDILTGDNIVPCAAATTGCTSGSFGYKAGAGYDLASGLGSVDAYNFVTHWPSVPAGTGTSTSLSASSSSLLPSGSVQLTAKVTAVSGASAPSGSVAFSLAGQTLGSAAIAASGTSASASFTLLGSALAVGSNTITATYVPTGNFAASSASTSVTVSAPPATTTTTVAASPATIDSTASTQLTAIVKAAGSTLPTGSVLFTLGKATLGSATLTASGAILAVKGSSLAIGTNVITATYSASSAAAAAFTQSSGTTSVMVTAPKVSTTTSLAANPVTLAPAASTVLTAVVKAATGTTQPTGAVTFTVGSATLGTVTLTTSGAALTIKASSLASGSNTITATYSGATGFAPSSGTTSVTVTTPAVLTTTSLAANPATLASTASTVLTATVRAATGTIQPAGSVTFTAGSTTLGTAALTASGAAVTIKASSLASGPHIITATYSGATGFAGSSGTITVTVTAPAAASVAFTATAQSPTAAGLPVTLQLQEKAGVAATLTGFTLNGASYSTMLRTLFGATQLPAHGTLTANLVVQGKPLPATLTFVISGTDANGNAFSQIATVSTSTR